MTPAPPQFAGLLVSCRQGAGALVKRGCGVMLIFLLWLSAAEAQAPAPRLKVSANGHWLQYADGRPFFYLGDTAWEIFRNLTREQADLYLTNRAQKGFSVIQASALSGEGGFNDPNAYGDRPLMDGNPAKPSDAYFRHVDYIVTKAASLGMFVGMLPTWGRNWTRFHTQPPYVFNVENARVYGRFLSNRYRNQPIIWILGGDQGVHSDEERAILEAMAAGLRAGDGGSHLITFHPRGPGRSSDYFPQQSILDFNMYQSSHGAHDHDNGLFAEHDYALKPPTPTIDGEPRYETIPVGFYYAEASKYDRMDDYDVRQAAYWSVLAGACGHTYGNNNIWQFWEPGRKVLIQANKSWEQSLDDPGAFQMGILRRLFESRPFQKLVPERGMIVDGPTTGGAKIRAELADDGSFAFIYSPRGAPFTLDRSRLRAQRLKEIWFDPRYGASYAFHTTENTAYQTYTPPTSGRGQDWLLVLEDELANFPPLREKP
jgi:hypothetical protein